MDAEIKRIIRVETADGKESVKSLKDEIKRLKDALVNITEGSEDWKKVTQQLVKDQEKLTSVTNAGKKTYDAAKDSIAGMEKEYKDLYATYRLLTEEQRKSDFGKNMAKSLETLSNKLNESKKEVGNYKDNIGRYSQGVMDAFSKMGISIGALQTPLKLAAGGVNTLGASLKTLAANPVGAVIMAVVVAFKALSAVAGKVKEAIAGNEEAQDRLNVAMSAFQPILDKVSNAWTALGNVVVGVIENISEAWQWIERVFSADKEATRERQELYKREAQAVEDLKKKKREYQILNAKDEDEVARLREEAAETENLSEKKKLLTQAMEKEEAIGQRNVELAQGNLQILQAQASHTANDAEMNDKLAEAEAEVSRASAQASRNQRKLQKELNGINKSLGGSNGTNNLMEDYLKKVREMDETIRKSNLTEVQKLEEERDAWLEIYKAVGKATDGIEEYYNKQIEYLKEANKKELKSKITDSMMGYLRTSDTAVNTAMNTVNSFKESLGSNGFSTNLDLSGGTMSFDETEQLRHWRELGEKIAENFREIIMSDSFPDAEESKQAAEKWLKDVLSFNLDYTSLKDDNGFNGNIKKVLNEVYTDIAKNLGDADNILGIDTAKVRISGDVLGNQNILNEEITEKIKVLKERFFELAQKVAFQEEEASAGQILELTNLATLVDNLIYAQTELNGLVETINETEALVKSGYANNATGNFFGRPDKQNVNGFNIDEEANALGRTLNNSAKVWADYGNAVSTVLDAVGNAWQKNIEKKLEDGEISEEQAQSEFKRIKAMQAGLAIISTAAGVIQCFSDPSLVTWYAKAAAAASVLATGTAQLITIHNTEFGSTVSSMGSGNIIQPYIYEQPPMNVRNTNTGDYIDALNEQRVYILDSDIAAAGKKVERREQETTF